jgi:hypothetical protein
VILKRGNMWDAFGKGIFMITTNPIIKKDSAVVMGRGIALEAKTKFPELPFKFGEALKTLHPEVDQQFVGPIGKFDDVPIWFFMVKDHWNSPASLSIIASSAFYLHRGFQFGDTRIDLNFPGIGNGKLNREQVLPLLEDLSDNIHIWEYA